ncbi:MAG: hypothetical protein HKN91_05950, partial [Acidimicrobiia bacterium]|nr:hypothetical protein [Acidimicrobiia bacterium]
MSSYERRGLRSNLAQLLSRRTERLALLLIGFTATIASFSEVLILVVISIGALRLSENTAVDLPFGLPIDELSPRLLLVFGLFALAVRLVAQTGNAYVSARLAASVIFRWRNRAVAAYQGASW